MADAVIVHWGVIVKIIFFSRKEQKRISFIMAVNHNEIYKKKFLHHWGC